MTAVTEARARAALHTFLDRALTLEGKIAVAWTRARTWPRMAMLVEREGRLRRIVRERVDAAMAAKRAARPQAAAREPQEVGRPQMK